MKLKNTNIILSFDHKYQKKSHMHTDRLCVWQMCLRLSRCWAVRSEGVDLNRLSKMEEHTEIELVPACY